MICSITWDRVPNRDTFGYHETPSSGPIIKVLKRIHPEKLGHSESVTEGFIALLKR